MCISTVPHFSSRKSCFDPSIYFYPSFENPDEADNFNCSDNNGVVVVVTEMDTMNNVHTFEVNDTDLTSLNLEDFDFPNVIYHVKPTWEIIGKTTAFVPVVVGGVILNLVILVTIVRNKWLWSPSNFLVANLAVVDLITLIFCPWMLLVHDLYQNYQLGSVGCKLDGFLQGSLLLTGVFIVLSVSYDRLAAVVLPGEAKVTRAGAACLSISSWIVGIFLALPLSLFRQYQERQWRNFLESFCSENARFLPMYWHVLISALVWVPLGAMIACYTAILLRLDRYAAVLARRGGAGAVRARTRAARVAALVLFTFAACRLPFTALVYWRSHLLKNAQINGVDGTFQIMWFLSHYLIYFNCALNPLIYGFSNERYRRGMARIRFFAFFFCESCCFPRDVKAHREKKINGISNNLAVIEPRTRIRTKIMKKIRRLWENDEKTKSTLEPHTPQPSSKETPISPCHI